MPDLRTIDDERGRFAGLAAILLALFVFALVARNGDWSAFVRMLLFLLAGTAVMLPPYLLARRDGPPPGWLSVLLVVGFFLTAAFWFSLADLLGANTDDLASSTVTWISVLLAAEYAYMALRHDSAICTLLAALAAVVAVLALIDWVFSPDGPSAFRYLMILEAAALLAAGVALHRDRGRHGTVLAALSGIVILALALTFLGELGLFTPFDLEGGGPTGPGWGWELVVLIFGLGLAAFAVITREPGPGYVAALLLVAFVALGTVGEDGFLGWPLVLLLLFAAALAAFLRGGEARPRVAVEEREVRL